tara:strand:+ start:87 stop:695 length:609 start_codon:yes stop_codon:yes gene_type:complete
MWGGVKVTEAPTALPLTAEQIRARLVLPLTGDATQDATDQVLLDAFQWQAVAMIDGPDGIGVAMSRQTWTRTADGFDDFRGAFLLPGAPLADVVSVHYMGGDGIWVEMAAADFRVVDGLDLARIVAIKEWPTVAIGTGVVRVVYTMGAAPGAPINPAWIALLSLLAGHYWENREAVLVGISSAELPLGVESILRRHSRVGAG